MSGTLRVADEKRGYTLVDRGSFLKLRKSVHLVLLVEGDPPLRNPYGAILVNPAKHPHVNAAGAKRLLDHLTSPEGQKRIGDFRVDGEVLFHPAGT
jgi:tungstate transport system substrate-binding protein